MAIGGAFGGLLSLSGTIPTDLPTVSLITIQTRTHIFVLMSAALLTVAAKDMSMADVAARLSTRKVTVCVSLVAWHACLLLLVGCLSVWAGWDAPRFVCSSD